MDFLALPEGRLAVAAGIGLVIGAERERRKGAGPSRSGAGIRTFTIVALLGGIIGMLASEALLIVGALLIGAIAVVAYWLGSREDPGFTSEVTLIATYCLGALAEQDPRIALAVGISVAALLALRAPLHRISRTLLTDDELRDALLFAVAAIVVLPLLPNRTVDPFGVLNPFTLWRLIVVLMAMSGAGYIAQRALGARYGLALAGVAGGFASSSATIAAMGTRARTDPTMIRPSAAGAAASTVSTFVQLAILIGTANPAFLVEVAWPLGVGGIVAALYAIAQTWKSPRVTADAVKGSAFQLSTAVAFGSLVTVVGVVSKLAHTWLGAAGTVATAAIAGFVDAHSSTAAIGAMSAIGQIDNRSAMIAILLALTTNTITKAVLASMTGPRRYWLLVNAGLVLVLVATWTTALITMV